MDDCAAFLMLQNDCGVLRFGRALQSLEKEGVSEFEQLVSEEELNTPKYTTGSASAIPNLRSCLFI